MQLRNPSHTANMEKEVLKTGMETKLLQMKHNSESRNVTITKLRMELDNASSEISKRSDQIE